MVAWNHGKSVILGVGTLSAMYNLLIAMFLSKRDVLVFRPILVGSRQVKFRTSCFRQIPSALKANLDIL